MKSLAFAFGLCIAAVGAIGILEPSLFDWIARLFDTSGAFYVLATVRIAFGLLLISVASASRMPKTLRVLGSIIVILGILTALGGLLALEQAQSAIDSWLRRGPGVVRFTGVFVMALGGFIAYACSPSRRGPAH